jgi:hypothetical protein
VLDPESTCPTVLSNLHHLENACDGVGTIINTSAVLNDCIAVVAPQMIWHGVTIGMQGRVQVRRQLAHGFVSVERVPTAGPAGCSDRAHMHMQTPSVTWRQPAFAHCHHVPLTCVYTDALALLLLFRRREWRR